MWTWSEDLQEWIDEQEEAVPLLALLDLLWEQIGTGLIRVESLAPLAIVSKLLWFNRMLDAITQSYITLYLLGRGGLSQMTESDWQTLGALLDEQREYLRNFFNELDGLSEAQIAARAKLYIRSAQQAFWKARGVAKGWPTLPAYPGDCSTQCCTNCRCYWDVVEVDGGWHAFWRLRPAEHCVDCLVRSVEWNPLVIEK